MSDVIPPAFAFRFAMPVSRVDAIPRRGKRLLKLGEECRIHWPGAELDSTSPPVELRAAWNDIGVGFEIRVSGKKHPAVSNPDLPDATDGFQVWIDTRNTQTIHRANRFCHHFCLLPNGGGEDGLAAIAHQLPIGRAVEDAPTFPAERFNSPLKKGSDPLEGVEKQGKTGRPERVRPLFQRAVTVRCENLSDGYRLEAWLPGDTLNGFDPEISPRLGFYCLLHDSELGQHFLTVDSTFPVTNDPSLWQTLELISLNGA